MDRDTLKSFIAQHCMARGQFVLSSGRSSPLYFDLRRATLHGTVAAVIGRVLFENLRPLGIDAVSGMSIGADPLICSVSREAELHGLCWHGLLVRSQAKGHGMKQQVEGLTNVKPGGHVAVLEDTCTTGGSSLKAVLALRDAGLIVRGVWAVVDRSCGEAAQLLSQHGVSFHRIFDEDEFK
jgi:orotate phosphoribosyltransferase